MSPFVYGKWGLNISKKMLKGCGVELVHKGGLCTSEMGAEHFTNLENHANRCFSSFGKWNRRSIGAKWMRIYIPRSWN